METRPSEIRASPQPDSRRAQIAATILAGIVYSTDASDAEVDRCVSHALRYADELLRRVREDEAAYDRLQRSTLDPHLRGRQ